MKYYVAKKIPLFNLNEKERYAAIQELQLLRGFKHPNIVSFKESYQEEKSLIIIMEYCEGKGFKIIFEKESKFL